MLQARIHRHLLHFRQPAGTSRGILNVKETWFLIVWDNQRTGIYGIGECSPLKGLSHDDRPGYTEMLEWLCTHISGPEEVLYENLTGWPSIRFGLETALHDLSNGGKRIIFPSEFTRGQASLPINGLVWMGNREFMLEQIRDKIAGGFRVIKIKVGAIDFESECSLLSFIREKFPEEEIEIRLDANGAFKPDEAVARLETLARFDIHSIEQPIRAGQPDAMERLCRISPIPVALDEELIGVESQLQKQELLRHIRPGYIILKPSLLGGFEASAGWISAAVEVNSGWWVTSALESNIGLNAIAQWTATLGNPLPQGLGTGALYTNNIPSPLVVSGGRLFYNSKKKWDETSVIPEMNSGANNLANGNPNRP